MFAGTLPTVKPFYALMAPGFLMPLFRASTPAGILVITTCAGYALLHVISVKRGNGWSRTIMRLAALLPQVVPKLPAFHRLDCVDSLDYSSIILLLKMRFHCATSLESNQSLLRVWRPRVDGVT